jgi:hypothetical protein
MKTTSLLIPTILGFCVVLASPGLGQQATPLPPPAGIGKAPDTQPGTGPAEAAPVASPEPSTPAIPAGEGRACKYVVMVEGIPYTWDKLEKGTDAAWVAYSNGDFTRSVPIFEKLAKLGHPVAERLMGVAYFFGHGVPLDYRTSLSWFEKAAMQGCFEAYAPTAQMYEGGLGTVADPGKAYMWYNIAAAQLPQGKERREMVDLREKVAAAMTPAQIEAAQKRSLQFAPRRVVPPDVSELPEDFFKQP